MYELLIQIKGLDEEDLLFIINEIKKLEQIDYTIIKIITLKEKKGGN